MDPEHSASYLYTLRLWKEDLGGGQTEWRGQLQHVLSGETRYFRDWATLVGQLEAMLTKMAAEDPDT